MEEMPRPRKPFVQRETTRHGKTVWYFRRGDGPRVRLRGDYESPEWRADYEAALGGRVSDPVRSQAGTLRWLVHRYYDSMAYASLAEATKRQRRSIFDRMLKTGGDDQLGSIKKKDVTDGRDLRSATPAAAVCFVKAVRGLFKWAVDAGHMADNPALGVEATDPKTDGHHTWTIAEVRKFQERFPVGTRQRLALDVLLYTGMRASDAIEFGRQHIRDGVIEYRSIKTRFELIIPLLDPLRASIEAVVPNTRLVILATEFGAPFSSVNSFGNWFRKQCVAAKVPGRAHGLRKAGATIAAEHGASDRELMAMFGWTTPKQAGVYTRKADRAKLAREAGRKLKAGTSIPAPRVQVRGSERKAE